MKAMKFLVLGLIVVFPLLLFCQTGEVTGKILDAQTQGSLPFAHVFVSNTTLGTTSDVEGNFLLKNVPIGTHDLIISYIGYQTFHSRVTVSETQTVNITLRLNQSLQELSGVEVKGTHDKEWIKQMRRFEKLFLGEKFISTCKIVNPWVIDFGNSGNSKVFIATASAPIEIVNNYLGYNVLFHLNRFQAGSQGYTIEGNAYFKEQSDPSREELWATNRAYVYSGSDRHLFKSILNNRVVHEGYRLYMDKPGAVDINTRSDLFYSEVNKKIIDYSGKNIVAPTGRPYEYTIQLSERTEIHYLNKTGSVKYYRDMAGAVSWMEVRGNQVRVNNNGILLNPGEVVYSGEWSNYRVGTFLPLDYQPGKSSQSSQTIVKPLVPIEKAYIHTDKPYYYPGENIWMKAYMNYSQPSLHDSLSKILYIELINEAKKIIRQKAVKIESGSAASDFKLPPDLPAGNYILRGYTNWMRNFGEQCFSLTPIPVLNLSGKLVNEVSYSTPNDSSLQVVANKESYQPREKVKITIRIQDKNKLPTAANLSIAITDEKQVASIKDEETIVTGLIQSSLPKPALIAYPVGQGIVLSGVFKNDKQKPENTNLTVVVGKFADFFMIDTDDKGKFTLNGLQFYDSVDFVFQAKDKRGKPYGHVSLMKRETPLISSWKAYKNLNIANANSPQRVFTQFEVDKEATLLEEVTITGSRIEELPTEIQHKIFGKPDHVIKGEALLNSGTTNLAVALQGKVPGLIITSAMGNKGATYKINIRGVSSILLNTETLVLIDGVPLGGSAGIPTTRDGSGRIIELGEMGDTSGDRLAVMDPNMVDRIEVTTRVNSLYGDAGRNGVIAIFTKAGSTSRLSNLEDLKTVDVYKIAGYSAPRQFRSPDYDSPMVDKEKPDFRSTIYWNPQLNTDDISGTCSVTFFAADLPGRYRITVEGIAETGNPIRSESFIVIQCH
jgi:hypothetical protein